MFFTDIKVAPNDRQGQSQYFSLSLSPQSGVRDQTTFQPSLEPCHSGQNNWNGLQCSSSVQNTPRSCRLILKRMEICSSYAKNVCVHPHNDGFGLRNLVLWNQFGIWDCPLPIAQENAVVLQGSRSVLRSTSHQRRGEEIITEFTFLSEPFC